MEDNIRIYYNEQCIFLYEDANAVIAVEQISNAWVPRKGTESIEQLFKKFIETDFKNMVLEYHTIKLLDEFKTRFKLIKAGGGVVWNDQGELLMIHRLGKWDLPKGKIEVAEDVSVGAVREVEEETGLQDIALKELVKNTYHIYNLNGVWILKQTAWYEMHAKKQNLVPQAEEDISEAVWVAKAEVEERLENSYPNIIFLLKNLI